MQLQWHKEKSEYEYEPSTGYALQKLYGLQHEEDAVQKQCMTMRTEMRIDAQMQEFVHRYGAQLEEVHQAQSSRPRYCTKQPARPCYSKEVVRESIIRLQMALHAHAFEVFVVDGADTCDKLCGRSR